MRPFRYTCENLGASVCLQTRRGVTLPLDVDVAGLFPS